MSADGVMQQPDLTQWRKSERDRLIKERLALSVDTRKQNGDRIAGHLDQAIGDVSGRVVSGYWPFRGEPDLREWLERLDSRGGRCALPVVVKAPDALSALEVQNERARVEKGRPMEDPPMEWRSFRALPDPRTAAR